MFLGVNVMASARDRLVKSNITDIFVYLLYFVIVMGITSCVELYNESNKFMVFVLGVIGTLVITPLNVGISKYMLNLQREDKKACIKDLFSGYKIMKKCFFMGLIIAILIVVGTFCFMIPGAMAYYGFSQVRYILAENPDISIKECLTKSYKMTDYLKWDICILQLKFLLFYMLGQMTYGVTNIILYPYYLLTMTNTYIKLEYDKDFVQNEVEIRKLNEQIQ